MKTNKQLIDDLTEYFLTQDHRTICRLLANAMVDLDRIYRLDQLTEEVGPGVAASLQIRMYMNSLELNRFAQHGPDGDIKVSKLEM